jgi:CRP-like cAMP-binding protein
VKIENEKIVLSEFDPQVLGPLKAEQVEILNLLRQGLSIVEIVQHFFNKRQLVSFLSIRQLLESLVARKLVVSRNLYDFFQQAALLKNSSKSSSRDLVINAADKNSKIDPSIIKKIPFLRSLNPELLKVLLENSNVTKAPKGVFLCHEGSEQRSLLVVLKGQASVYRKDEKGQQNKLVVLTENSVFGEVAFFFGTPRTATVVADSDCEILVLRYIPEIYDGLIKTEKARELQWRIWAVHALLKSEMFKNLPQESFDDLIFAGEMKTFEPNMLICRQGDPGETCYLIVQGKVTVHKDDKLLKRLEQGDCFGELALMVSGGIRTATVKTESSGIALEIHRNKFYRLLAENLLMACEFEKMALLRRLQQARV